MYVFIYMLSMFNSFTIESEHVHCCDEDTLSIFVLLSVNTRGRILAFIRLKVIWVFLDFCLHPVRYSSWSHGQHSSGSTFQVRNCEACSYSLMPCICIMLRHGPIYNIQITDACNNYPQRRNKDHTNFFVFSIRAAQNSYKIRKQKFEFPSVLY